MLHQQDDPGRQAKDDMVPCRRHGDTAGWCIADPTTGEHVALNRCVCGSSPATAPSLDCPVPSHKRRAEQFAVIKQARTKR